MKFHPIVKGCALPGNIHLTVYRNRNGRGFGHTIVIDGPGMRSIYIRGAIREVEMQVPDTVTRYLITGSLFGAQIQGIQADTEEIARSMIATIVTQFKDPSVANLQYAAHEVEVS